MKKRYRCIPLRCCREDFELIKEFKIDREKDVSSISDKIIGLEAYLKRLAEVDDFNNKVRIYLIKDTIVNDIAAYFGLKAGMVVNAKDEIPSEEDKELIMNKVGAMLLPDVIPGIEISHFAVNDNYRRKIANDGVPIKGLGEYFYPEFIYPIVDKASSLIGVHMAYLYAAGDDKLVKYYESVFEFQSLDSEDYYIPLQPTYDGGCPFLYKIL